MCPTWASALVTQILPPASPKAPQCPSLSCLKKRLIGMRTYKNIGDTYKQKWMLPSVSSVCSSLPYLFSHPFPLPHPMPHYRVPPPHDSHPSPVHFLFSSSPLLLQGSRFAGRKQHIPVCLPFQLLQLPSLRSPSAPNISRDSPVMVDEPELTHRAPLAPCGPVIKTAPIPSCLATLLPTTANYLLLSLA